MLCLYVNYILFAYRRRNNNKSMEEIEKQINYEQHEKENKKE